MMVEYTTVLISLGDKQCCVSTLQFAQWWVRLAYAFTQQEQPPHTLGVAVGDLWYEFQLLELPPAYVTICPTYTDVQGLDWLQPFLRQFPAQEQPRVRYHDPRPLTEIEKMRLQRAITALEQDGPIDSEAFMEKFRRALREGR